MTNNITDISQRKIAIVTGLAIVLMALIAGFSFGFVHSSLVIPGDAAATATNISAAEPLFRAGIFGWLLILILDVIVAWGLYIILKAASKSLSLLMGWLRLVYATILGVALLNFVIVLLLLSGADYLSVFATEQLHALVLLFLNAFSGIWEIGLIVFGLHLLLLGYLAFKSGFIPKILGVLLLIAAGGYLIVDLGNLLLPTYEATIGMIELVFTLPMIVGELGLGLWLLIRGGQESAIEA